jgi:large subunit ribosomal protein L29
MKSVKYPELLAMDAKQLEKQIAENQARITALNFQKVIGQLDNHAQFTTLRRDIARMQTALTEKKRQSK